MLEIEEVLRRSTQGMTKPYICITEDRNSVFVKGLSAMRQGQINEWICGNLARRFGLPIPDFEIVNVPAELMKINTDVDLSELGIGPAFSSKKLILKELTYASIEFVPENLKQDVFIFDWWIRNGDRNLTELGGNPNLFWEVKVSKRHLKTLKMKNFGIGNDSKNTL